MANKIYLTYVIIVSFVCTLAIAGVNYLINPFNVFNLQRIEGINKIKPEAATRVRVFKKYQPIFVKPEILIIGNSRVEMGLDPKHQKFKDKITYNLGIPGIGVVSQLQYSQNVIDNADIREVFLSVDFVDFLTKENFQFKPQKLDIQSFSDRYAALFSLDAFKASISTVLSQNTYQSNRLDNGFNPANDYRPIIQFEGQHVLFQQKISVLSKMLAGKSWNEKSMLENDVSSLSLLSEYVNKWLNEGIDVNVFINPYHSEYYKVLEQYHLIQDFNNWRTLLNAIFPKKVNFCDFTELGQRTSDDKLSEKELKYFWEPAHYKKELGDIMIDKIINGC